MRLRAEKTLLCSDSNVCACTKCDRTTRSQTTPVAKAAIKGSETRRPRRKFKGCLPLDLTPGPEPSDRSGFAESITSRDLPRGFSSDAARRR